MLKPTYSKSIKKFEGIYEKFAQLRLSIEDVSELETIFKSHCTRARTDRAHSICLIWIKILVIPIFAESTFAEMNFSPKII